MSRTAGCLGLLPLVGRWTVDRLMVVVYMNGVVSCGCVGASATVSTMARHCTVSYMYMTGYYTRSRVSNDTQHNNSPRMLYNYL